MTLINFADGTTEFSGDVVEGLPQHYSPTRSDLFGRLVGDTWYNFNTAGSDPRDDKDHPASDHVQGGISGGLDVCLKGGAIENHAFYDTSPVNGNYIRYDPSSALFGRNGNWLAWELLTSVGLNFGQPPRSPGYGPDPSIFLQP